MSLKLGLHVKVGAGYDEAVDYAHGLGCSSLQFFSGNPKTYRIGPIDRPGLEHFAAKRKDEGIVSAVIHTSYLINLASEDPKTAGNSLRLLSNELAVAAAGSVAYVNTHLGSYGKRDRNEGFAQVVDALEQALEHIQPGVFLVMENSAGAGQLCGGTIEELGRFIRAIDHPQLAVCIDTAHSWAAGYKIDTAEGVDAFLDEADREIGLERVVMFHLNDTQIELGGHKDRHWHIGEGNIGLAGFRAFVNHPGVRDKTAILETPGDDADDRRNVERIFALVAA
jgi:deoxyribonuclease-4